MTATARSIGWRTSQARRPAGAEIGAEHHAGIELDLAVAVEAGTDTGVEEGFVLHVTDRRHCCGQCAVSDAGPSGVARAVDSGLAELALGVRDRTCAAVDDQGRAGQRRPESLLSLRLGPLGAALEKATLGDTPVEGVGHASGGAGALGVAALAKPPIHA